VKRLILAVAGTIAGLIALLTFRTHPGPAAVGSLPAATLGPAPSLVTPSARPGAVTTLGQTVQTQYDTIQVRIVTVRGQIRSVAFAKLAGDEQLSDLINAHAGPLLLQRTLIAQGADIDAVSGATYTSDGYRQSLQSALDKAAGQ
jgi:FMN-binding domain